MTSKLTTALFAAASAAALAAPIAAAQTAPAVATEFDIAAQELGAALREYSQISGREVIAATTLVAGKRSRAVRGRLSPEAALARLLAGTGLIFAEVDDTLVLRAATAQSMGADDAARNDIVVTGTRIRGSGPVGSSLTSFDRAALDQSGRATVSDFLQLLPQNFSGGPAEGNVGHSARGYSNTNISFGTSINLRGLGPGATLTLFDGSRPALGGGTGAFTDLSLVPTAAIERIELLTDGASAIYGADAIAGVVNIRFRNRFEGAETRLRAGTADGDYGEYQLGQIFGLRWGSGAVTLAGEYYQRGNLASTQRAFASEDLRPFGGPDLRSNFAVPGTIVAANGQRFAIPAGQDGRNLTDADLIAGVTNRGDTRRNIDILPQQETFSLYLSGEQDLGDTLLLFARGLYAERRYTARTRIFGAVPVTVTPNNPFYVDPIGTGQNISVLYDPSADFGPETARGKVRALNTNFGVRAALGDWSAEIAGSYGLQRETGSATGVVQQFRLNLAARSSDPATAINLFGDGAVNDPVLINSLRGNRLRRLRYENLGAAIRADGPLLTLPAGEVKLALGGEYRRDRVEFESIIDRSRAEPLVTGFAGLPEGRNVGAIYSEVVAPLFDAGQRFPGSLTLSAAARYEDYSDVGTSVNPKFGARWTPLPGLALRASYGQSFRAPYFDELVGEANALYQTIALPDPQSPTGSTVVLGLFGLRPDLGAEKAESWTVGADLEPRLVPGLRVSASWFEIQYSDRIASASFDLFNFLVRRDLYSGIIDETPDPAEVAFYFADPRFVNAAGIAASDVGIIVDGRTRNLSSSTVRGVDFDIGYSRPIGDGSLALSLGGTRLFKIDSRITAQAPPIPVLATLGNPGKLRLRGRAGFTYGAWDGGVGVNHISGYRNQTVVPEEQVASWTTFDLQLGAGIAAGKGQRLRVALSVNNLFDRDPPYVQFRTPTSGFGYDPEQASAIGRNMALQVVVAW